MPRDDLQRLLADDYLHDLRDRSLDEIRSMRAECQQAELGLSYLRRLVQGRLDIVETDRRRRREGGPPADLAALVEELPKILSEHVHAPGGPGRLANAVVPPDEEELTAELDSVVDVRALGSLSELSDQEEDRLIDRLARMEREVSDRRRALHQPLDAIESELARRYASGEASVESLLQ